MADKPMITHPEYAHFRVLSEVGVVLNRYDDDDHHSPDGGYSVTEVGGSNRPPFKDRVHWCITVVGKLRPGFPDDKVYVCFDDEDIFLLELEDTRE